MRLRMTNCVQYLEDNRDDSCCQQTHHCCKSSNFNLPVKSNIRESISMKFLKTPSGNLGCYSRVSSWGFAGAHVMKIWNSHSSEFAGVHTASVVSTGSGSRPSINFLRAYLNVHSVASFNRLNIAPANRVLNQGIIYNDALIVKSHFGFNKEQVSRKTEEGVDKNCSDANTGVALVEVGERNPSAEKEHTKAIEKTALGTKHLRVVHEESFSWKSIGGPHE